MQVPGTLATILNDTLIKLAMDYSHDLQVPGTFSHQLRKYCQ